MSNALLHSCYEQDFNVAILMLSLNHHHQQQQQEGEIQQQQQPEVGNAEVDFITKYFFSYHKPHLGSQIWGGSAIFQGN